MDGGQFDALTRRLAGGLTRRRVLGALSGAFAGMLAIPAGAAVARPGGAICRKNGDCASRVCLPKDATGRQRCQSVAGEPCAVSTDCASNFCADGVCCDRACTGQCESCSLQGNVGICRMVTGMTTPGRPACAGSGPCAGTCTGASSSCVYPGPEVTCGDSTCVGTTYTAPAACDGNGLCQPGEARDCDPFFCGDGACLEICSEDDDCSSNFCVESACCAGDDFCEGICCSPDRAPTETCCFGTGQCCECFERQDPGNERIECCPEDKLCRSLTNSPAADTCCHNDEVCVNGTCCWVGKACEDQCCQTKCCNGACCADGEECAVAPGDSIGSCQPVRSCTSDSDCDTAALENCAEQTGVCCPPERQTSYETEIDGVPTILKFCCPYGQAESVRGGPDCCPEPDRCGTSRGKFGRF